MIEVNDESGFEPAPNLEEINQLATFVLDQMRVHPLSDLSVLLVDEKTMEDLHIKWMDLPGPTDVLSFPMDELRPTPPGEEPKPGMLGDIVVCPQVARRQALNMGHSTAEEILLLVTHGILHLLGFDHADPKAKEEMFGLQRKLLLIFLADRGGGDPKPTEV
ncbi:rRNA maturation RNase YbeY [Neoactinobaculum massilliense]|uniref:rRNA maturation RNase YbeY n=1 Tax=Neoactinobaculum massilliense TaxID=2364794 RepID=UPI000F533E9E|nr:rRNA maturation RNase YbeY [Neoactinobaculum massilliense]